LGSQKRSYKRYKKRLEVEFSAAELTFKGISADVSERGMFIRTRYPFKPGTEITIKLYLPDGQTARLKGLVRHAFKSDIMTLKNGMGVEFLERDMAFERFLKTHVLGHDPEPLKKTVAQTSTIYSEREEHKKQYSAFLIITCGSCGAKNRVREDKLELKPKCGRCGNPLTSS